MHSVVRARAAVCLAGFILLAGCFATASRTTDGARGVALEGCYRVTPAFTYAAYGRSGSRDSAWALLRLASDSVVTRPLLRRHTDLRGRWWVSGDTLRIRVHDLVGVGWDAWFTAAGEEWRGKGRYLTDVIGGEPVVREFSLARQPCS